jgi:hypothetical protein
MKDYSRRIKKRDGRRIIEWRPSRGEKERRGREKMPKKESSGGGGGGK